MEVNKTNWVVCHICKGQGKYSEVLADGEQVEMACGYCKGTGRVELTSNRESR